MIRITKKNIDSLRIGMYFLYEDIQVTRVYRVENIITDYGNYESTFIRSNYYSSNGTFGDTNSVYYTHMIGANYHLLNEKDFNYYTKLMVFK